MSTTQATIRSINLVFVWLVTLFLCLTVISLWVINRLDRQVEVVIHDHYTKIDLMGSQLKMARERSLAIQNMLLVKDPFALDQLLMDMGTVMANYFANRERLLSMPLSLRERELLERQHTQTLNTGRVQSQISELLLGEEFAAAYTLFLATVTPSQERAMALMEEFIALQRQLISEVAESMRSQIMTATIELLLLLASGILSSIALALWVTKHLKLEINRRDQFEQELEQRVAERTRELDFLASHDTLTALPNRSMFTTYVTQRLSHLQRKGGSAALFFLDLDGFKAVNDNYGHQAGDRVLLEIANRLKAMIRSEDMVSRLGGDEFTLFVADISKEDRAALTVAKKILAVINRPICLEEQGIACQVGVSIGIAYYPHNGATFDDILTSADNMMYDAKKGGKNQIIEAI